MSARRSLLYFVVGLLLGGAAVVQPVEPPARPDPGMSNFRLMNSGPPVQS